MWRAFLLLSAAFWEPVAGLYFLSKSDSICRDESFLFYWRANDCKLPKDVNPYDISNDCYVRAQTWFSVLAIILAIFWVAQLLPAIVNFIEGIERRTECCADKTKK
ncbi:unnamed protein product [Caenorhabditis sp. 36 PRJEB53466]|nr:unnamed protein product [Caenorhabditis sp. 36 PRJEB53466]